MATTALDKAGCGCGNGGSGGSGATADAVLPANPYTALQYHFGMLLGVDDLETAQAYPRGKIRLHNAWLHREGVVWGLNVSFNPRRELAVAPGLALDAAGHELHLDTTACVDLGKWYDKHKDDEEFIFVDDGNAGKTFDVHVVARFRACFARPVPAIADPCAGSDVDTAFSRVTETIELLLRPGAAPAKDLGYHRLRILFSLEDDAPEYDEVRTRRESIQAMAAADQPRAYLTAFREFAALDEIDLAPQTDALGATNSLFPEDPTEVVLADVLGIHVGPSPNGGSGFTIVDPVPTPNVRVRPSHVATATIQELLCGPLFAAVAAASESAAPSPTRRATALAASGGGAEDAGGPRGDAGAARVSSARRISLDFTSALDAPSVRASGFSVTTYARDSGWSIIDVGDARVDGAGTGVVLELKTSAPANQLVRVIARGTGPDPILGTNLIPLAGAIGGPAGSTHDGHDFVITLQRS